MFESKPASRGSVKPLIGLFSESGCGKSMSALLLARGLVGPQGNIQQIDTEAGRGELYSDVIPGGYKTIRMSEPFSPSRYIEAVRFAENQKADVIVIDQISNEWEGIGGVLDLAMQNEEAGKKGLSVWKGPKMEHAKMMVRLLQSPCPIIVCLRAKYKSRQTKVGGKTEIVKDEFTTPIQADDFIFEMTAHAEILHDHSINLTKCSHPDLRKCFPEKGPITIEHGKLIAAWCAAPKGPGTGKEAVKTEIDPRGPLLKELRDLTTDIHGWSKELGAIGWGIAKPKMESWIRDELGQDTLLDAMTIEQLQETISAAKRRLKTLPGEKGQAQLV